MLLIFFFATLTSGRRRVTLARCTRHDSSDPITFCLSEQVGFRSTSHVDVQIIAQICATEVRYSPGPHLYYSVRRVRSQSAVAIVAKPKAKSHPAPYYWLTADLSGIASPLQPQNSFSPLACSGSTVQLLRTGHRKRRQKGKSDVSGK